MEKLKAMAGTIPKNIGEWGAYRTQAWKVMREECGRRAGTVSVPLENLRFTIRTMEIVQTAPLPEVAGTLEAIGVCV